MITKRKKYVKPMIGTIVSKRRMRLLVNSNVESKSGFKSGPSWQDLDDE